MIESVDNFLEKKYFKKLQKKVFGPHFPWYKNDGKVSENDGYIQFIHRVYRNNEYVSGFSSDLIPCVEKLGVLSLIRIKLNLTLSTTEMDVYEFHKDLVGSRGGTQKTSILYMNTNNGFTMFENGDKIESVANRMITFPSETRHTGTSNTDEDIMYRCVINFNYFPN